MYHGEVSFMRKQISMDIHVHVHVHVHVGELL